MWLDHGMNQGQYGSWNAVAGLCDLLPGLQPLREDNVDASPLLIDEAALQGAFETPPFRPAEVTARADDKVRVQLHLGIHGGPQLADHLLDRDTAAAGHTARLLRGFLILEMDPRDAGLDELLHGPVDLDGIAIAGIGIREHRDVHRQGDTSGIVDDLPHAGDPDI